MKMSDLPNKLTEIQEYRGVEGLVAAKVLVDDNETGEGHGYVTGPVFAIAGVAEVTKAVETSNETHYYDNVGAIVIDGVGPDTITVNTSAIPIDVQAELTGQAYLQDTGALVEGGNPTAPYFALGYLTHKTDGSAVYVWRHKGKIALGDLTNSTKTNQPAANGQSFTYTGIDTTHKWTKTGKTGKGLVVEASRGLADVTGFFDAVKTPDTLQPVSQQQQTTP